MGLRVRIEDAARLVSRHERIVRQHLAQPKGSAGYLPSVVEGRRRLIDTDDLGRVPGWTVNRTRLAELEQEHRQTPAGMAADIRALRVEIETLRRRIDALELARTGGSRTDTSHTSFSWQSDGADSENLSALVDFSKPSESPLTAIYDRSARALPVSDEFRTYTEAARWLVAHGISSEKTPVTWHRWKDVVPLQPRAILRDAIERQEEAIRERNWRVKWRLTRCDDPSCFCGEMLP